MYACKDNFQSKLVAQALVNYGADLYASANGKTPLDYAESISQEFHAALIGTNHNLTFCFIRLILKIQTHS
jgi:hypothetical protein